MSMFWTNLKKKKNWKFEKNFQKSSIFEISFVGLRPKFRPIGRKFRQKYSFAQNSYQKNFESNPTITSSKYPKSRPPPQKKWPFFFWGGGGSHFICDLSQ